MFIELQNDTTSKETLFINTDHVLYCAIFDEDKGHLVKAAFIMRDGEKLTVGGKEAITRIRDMMKLSRMPIFYTTSGEKS